MSTALAVIGNKLSQRFGMGDNAEEVLSVLKNTAFKGPQVTDAQMTALMIVADQYGLNPFTKEIYAFPDRQNGIVPVVGVDGWSRIINEHAQFDGLDFDQNDESCTCVIYRKDRSHPIKVTEWMAECKRDNAQPWKTHPKRMLRHKALIQCARLAFGFTGIYDQDEAERIVEIDVQSGKPVEKPQSSQRPALEYCTDTEFVKMVSDTVDPETGEVIRMRWKSGIQSGKTTAESAIQTIQTRILLTDGQIEEIKSWEPINA
jgi:phage recombination protein Bet